MGRTQWRKNNDSSYLLTILHLHSGEYLEQIRCVRHLLWIIANSCNTSASREWHPSFTDVEVSLEKRKDLPRVPQLTRDLRPGFKPRYLPAMPGFLLMPLSPQRKKEKARTHVKIK